MVKNPQHFQKVNINAVALIKMVMHAQSGGECEVMGMLQGFCDGETINIMDVFGLPVKGDLASVSETAESNLYKVDH